MGVDACMTVKFKNVPDKARLKRLQYDLMHRFDRSPFMWRDNREDFISQFRNYDEIVKEPRLFDISLTGRYYGEDYERGDGLKLAGICLFLLTQSDIEELKYYGDSSEYDEVEPMTNEGAMKLLSHFIADGRMSYSSYFDHDEIGSIGANRTRPDCSFCEIPYIRNGWGGAYAGFYCMGCGEKATLRGAEYHGWVEGRDYTLERKAAEVGA